MTYQGGKLLKIKLYHYTLKNVTSKFISVTLVSVHFLWLLMIGTI